MKPAYQTIFDFKTGNCMQACVASLFEVDLKEIPNFMEKGDDYYYENIKKWADDNNLIAIDLVYNKQTKEYYKDTYIIVVGKSSRNDKGMHAVIYYNDKLVHDPFPGGMGFKNDPEICTIFCVKDLKNLKED